MVERLSVKPRRPNFILNATNVIAYKKLTRSIQWFNCQTQPNIIQTIANLS